MIENEKVWDELVISVPVHNIINIEQQPIIWLSSNENIAGSHVCGLYNQNQICISGTGEIGKKLMNGKFLLLKKCKEDFNVGKISRIKKMQSEFTADKIIVSKYNEKTGELFLS